MFLPILLATFASTLTSFFSVAFMQRLRLSDPVVLAWWGWGHLAAGDVDGGSCLTDGVLASLSGLLGNLLLFGLIIAFVGVGAYRKVPLFESFIYGAKQGFDLAKDILAHLIGMLCAVGVMPVSGALDFALGGIRWLVLHAELDPRFVDALPTLLVKAFSGSAARAMLIETMHHAGVDSFPALLTATMQGRTRNDLLQGRGVLRRNRHPSCSSHHRLCVAGQFGRVLASMGVCCWFSG